jgi:hypothetical protein
VGLEEKIEENTIPLTTKYRRYRELCSVNKGKHYWMFRIRPRRQTVRGVGSV